MRYILGLPLQFDPGAERHYSNVGFLALGLIVEELTGQNVDDFVRSQIIEPFVWCPVSEVVSGRTFPDDRDSREPWYQPFPIPLPSVFSDEPCLPASLALATEGAWYQEGLKGFGGIVTSTTVLLHMAQSYYLERYRYGDRERDFGVYGRTRDREMESEDGWSGAHHGGFLDGSETTVQQRPDDIHFAVHFNASNYGAVIGGPEFFRQLLNEVGLDESYATQIRELLDAKIDELLSKEVRRGFTWPTQGVDGQWVDFEHVGLAVGSYESPYSTIPHALGSTPGEGTLNFKPGSSSWTGTISQQVRLRAHGGRVRIGE